MTAFFFSGFLLAWQWVVLFYLLLELQLTIFEGCSVTKLQQKMGFIDSDRDFIPVVVHGLFKVEITDMQHALISYFIMGFPVYVVVIRAFL
jgi:hypothetical protein